MNWKDYTSFLNKHNFKMRLKKMSNAEFVEKPDGGFELHFKVKKKLYPTRQEKASSTSLESFSEIPELWGSLRNVLMRQL